MSKEINGKVYTVPEIIALKIKNNDFGCVYAIKNIVNGKYYIGQSYKFLNRSKAHVYNAIRNKGILVDMEMNKNILDFVFIVLITYDELGVNFHNRKIRTITEHKLINEYNSLFPNGYNKTYYGFI